MHAGDGAQAFFELAGSDGALFRLLQKSIGLNLKGEEAMRIEPGIDALQFEKAADHKSRADQEYVCEGDFEADDDFAREATAGEGFTAARAAQNDHHIWASRAPCRRQTKDGSGYEARNYSEDQHGRINSNRIEAREMRGSDGEQFVNSDPRDAEAA